MKANFQSFRSLLTHKGVGISLIAGAATVIVGLATSASTAPSIPAVSLVSEPLPFG